MPTIAVFISQGDLGECAHQAVVHALSLNDRSLTIKVIARDAADIGAVLTHDERMHPQLTTHVIPYDTDSQYAMSQLTAILADVAAVIAAPSSRQAFKERAAAGSMRALCAAMNSRYVTVRRLVYLSTPGIDSPPMPWSPAGKKLAAALAVGRAIRPDFRRADAAVRDSGLEYTIVRPVGLDGGAKPRGAWTLLPAEDRHGPLEANVAPEDVGMYMFQEAMRAHPRSGQRDVIVGWAPATRAGQAVSGSVAAAALEQSADPLARPRRRPAAPAAPVASFVDGRRPLAFAREGRRSRPERVPVVVIK